MKRFRPLLRLPLQPLRETNRSGSSSSRRPVDIPDSLVSAPRRAADMPAENSSMALAPPSPRRGCAGCLQATPARSHVWKRSPLVPLGQAPPPERLLAAVDAGGAVQAWPSVPGGLHPRAAARRERAGCEHTSRT